MTMDIHAPTTEQAAVPTDQPAGVPQTKEGLMEVIRQKDGVEAELKALGSVLESHGVTMETPLVDAQDFPRSDIDVAQVRTVRAQIHRLRNDWKNLMKLIEKGLEVVFEPASPVELLSSAQASSSVAAPPSAEESPFATVKSVAPASPAADAGLQPGDMIRTFGSATAANNQKLKLLSQEVQKNEGNRIKVVLSRAEGGTERDHVVYLTPRQGWGGKGMLGCHIVPL